jgi:hypothetical protein
VLLATSLFGVALAAIGAWRGRAADRAIAAALVAHLLAVVLAGGDWMPGYRLLVPVLPLYALLAGVGVARARTRAAWALLGLACVVPALDLRMRIPELRDNEYTRARMIEVAHWLNGRAHRVALVDIGLIGYASDLQIIDLAGLTDPRIAHLPGSHLSKRIAPRDLQARDPDAIVVHCADTPRISDERRLVACAAFEVERRVLAMPFVQAGYRVGHVAEVTPPHDYRSSYSYVILMRDELRAPTAPRDR